MNLPLDSDDELGQEDTRRVETRDGMNDAPPGPTGVPEFIPLSAQTPLEEPLCTPVDPDRPVGVPINEDPRPMMLCLTPCWGVADRHPVKSRGWDPEDDGWGKTQSAKARGPPFLPCP